MPASAVVIGGGLAGLAAAHRLQEAGQDVTVLERAAVPGGCARTERHGGYLVDTGCDLVNGSFERYLGLAREVGLGGQIVEAARPVDILRDGRALTVDRGRPLSLLRTPVLSPRGKLTAARGYARLRPRLRGLDPYSLTSHADSDHGTARELCERYFDDEVTDHLIDPILRAFAGTGTRHAGGLSLLAALAVGTRPAYAIEGGMSALPRALAAGLDVRCDAEVLAVDERDDGVTVTHRDGGGAERELRADTCVLAVAYHDALPLWPALASAAGPFGDHLKPVPLLSITLGYDAPSPTPAYVVLVPTRESDDALLAMMQHNKAADRAPAGHTLVTLFTEALATPRLMARTDDELTGWASAFVERYYPALAGRRDLAIVTRWPNTGYWPIPGFWKGIADMRERLPRRRIHPTSTLFGSGGVERAVLGGQRTADRIIGARAESNLH